MSKGAPRECQRCGTVRAMFSSSTQLRARPHSACGADLAAVGWDRVKISSRFSDLSSQISRWKGAMDEWFGAASGGGWAILS